MQQFKLYKNIVDNGQYYNPASKHYPNVEDPVISCDKCNRIRIESCIGWNDYDLCLDCCSEVSNGMEDLTTMTLMMQEQYRYPSCPSTGKHKITTGPSIATNMMQGQFRPASEFNVNPSDPFSNYAPIIQAPTPVSQYVDDDRPRGLRTKMLQGQFLTRMLQNQFTPNDIDDESGDLDGVLY